MASGLPKQLAAALLATTLAACGAGGSSDGTQQTDTPNGNNNQTTIDTTAPVITLLGASTVQLPFGAKYVEAGATAADDIDGDISANVVIGGDAINSKHAGTYRITYDVADAAGNTAVQVVRTVVVAEAPVIVDTTAPVISLIGAQSVSLAYGDSYYDAGATAYDDVDGDISASIVVNNPVNPLVPGSYTVSYDVTDSAGNVAATMVRLVIVAEQDVVVADTTAPVLTLLGAERIQLTVGDSYVDAGATAHDNVDGDISGQIVVGNGVDTSVAGSYQVTYSVSDAAGNQASAYRTVVVARPADTVAPVITLLGDASITLAVGDSYTDAGATALDDQDGDLTASITVSNSVDTSTEGTYTVTYSVQDAAGNTAVTVSRTVIVEAVADTVAPVITLVGDEYITVTVGETYADAGATAIDDIDGDLSASIQVSGSVDTSVAGEYTLVYSVVDAAGNQAVAIERTVVVADAALEPVTATIAGNGERALTISWNDVAAATYYQLYENKDGASGYVAVGDPVAAGVESISINVSLYDRVDASYVVSSCNVNGCVDSAAVSPALADLNDGILRLDRVALGESIKLDSGLGFNGTLSADGTTLVFADSNSNANYGGIGKIYVLKRAGAEWQLVWSQELLNPVSFSRPAVNADGSAFVIGDAGYYGDRGSSQPTGQVFLYYQNGENSWTELYLSELNSTVVIGASSRYGANVALSGQMKNVGDTLRLAVSAPDKQASISTGGLTNAGRVYLYDITATTTGFTVGSQYFGCPNEDCYTSYIENATWNINPNFGNGLALSADGLTLAVGYQSSEAENVNIFRLDADDITETPVLLAHDPVTPPIGARFAETLSLSEDGSVLAIGAPGSVSMYVMRWTAGGYELDSSTALAAATTMWYQEFGKNLEISRDGRTIAIGAPGDRSDGYGINADPSNLDTEMINSGAVYVLKDPDGTGDWVRSNFIRSVKKAPTDNIYCDYFGISVSLADDGTLAIGANNLGCSVQDRNPALYLY
ncbi:DUF5011 domain-containing protein [Oceanobacter mangrovi]|uniref:DUF5011 domain-containing protein n=1 Tax=Oceanobacter mangrovi TaxID=2862510 RepID=UPI001C8EBD82|nr:DUF5011 domain-containing protein [Oceanobacter mangrovi]